MRARIRHIGHISVVDLYGKITIGVGDRVLREKVHELIDNGKSSILVNLRRVSYMDSCGIGELAACYQHARQHNAVLKLLNPGGRVYDLLQMIRLEEMIECFRDEKEALVSFN